MSLNLKSMCPLLQVFDMPRSIAFYRDTLGFQVVQSAPPGDDCDWCLLRHGNIELMLNTRYERQDRPPTADPLRTAIHDDTALFFSCPDLDAAYASLRACGVELSPPIIQAYGMRQLYFKDPDGYSICLQWAAG